MMKFNRCVFLVSCLIVMGSLSTIAIADESCPRLINHNTTRLAESDVVNLCDEFQGKVVLVVNTASRCAFTSQYEGLEKLYAKYQDQGFVVAGFPSNDFAG